MTASINASLTAGVVVSSDTSGSLALQTAGTSAVTIDTSQNVGIGVTPSAWYTVGGYKSIEIARVGNGITSLSASDIQVRSNCFLNTSGVSTYANTGFAANYEQYNSGHYWYTAPSGTAGNTISFTQSLAVGKGTTLVLENGTSSSGTGIAFPATQNPSSNVNTLDDYETGTWTPTDGSGAGLTFSATSGNCLYTKIGRLVTVSFVIAYPTTASSATNQINGLPFTCSNTSNNVFGGSPSLTTLGTGMTFIINGNQSTFSVYNFSGSTLTNVNLTGVVYRGILQYYV
jgi:hypothetical protein